MAAYFVARSDWASDSLDTRAWHANITRRLSSRAR